MNFKEKFPAILEEFLKKASKCVRNLAGMTIYKKVDKAEILRFAQYDTPGVGLLRQRFFSSCAPSG